MTDYPEQRAYYLYIAKTQVKEPELKRTLTVMAEHIGKDNPILIEQLAAQIYGEARYERQTRDDLLSLRDDYEIPIGSNSGTAGRWIIVDSDDLHHTANEIDGRGYKLINLGRKMRSMNLRPRLTPQAMAEITTNQGRLWG